MRNHKIFSSSNIVANSLTHMVGVVNGMIVVKQIHVTVVVVLVNIGQHFLLQEFGVRLFVSALQNVQHSQAMKAKAEKQKIK